MILPDSLPVVGFHDLEFATERVLCASSIGRPTHRLIRFGMPRLNPRLAKSVFYLYGRNPQCPDEIIGPSGTGLIVGRLSEAGRVYNIYGVTNWHVAVDGGSSIIRINTKNGATRLLEFEPSDWQFIPNSDDIAAIDLTEDIYTDDDIVCCGENEFVSREALTRLEIGVGEDVFMMGLYADYHGGEINIPVGRFGNLAMVASKKALAKQGNGVMRPSYLTDMRSRSGFSGSPVFLYRIPGNDLRVPPWKLDESGTLIKSAPPAPDVYDNLLGLLGIHCGQIWEDVEVQTAKRVRERLGDPVHEGDELFIPGAMNVVAPAWAITDLLDLEIFEMARKKRLPAQLAAVAKAPRPESVKGEVNPRHREDFTSLLNAAAKKQIQDGQTSHDGNGGNSDDK